MWFTLMILDDLSLFTELSKKKKKKKKKKFSFSYLFDNIHTIVWSRTRPERRMFHDYFFHRVFTIIVVAWRSHSVFHLMITF